MNNEPDQNELISCDKIVTFLKTKKDRNNQVSITFETISNATQVHERAVRVLSERMQQTGKLKFWKDESKKLNYIYQL